MSKPDTPFYMRDDAGGDNVAPDDSQANLEGIPEGTTKIQIGSIETVPGISVYPTCLNHFLISLTINIKTTPRTRQ